MIRVTDFLLTPTIKRPQPVRPLHELLFGNIGLLRPSLVLIKRNAEAELPVIFEPAVAAFHP